MQSILRRFRLGKSVFVSKPGNDVLPRFWRPQNPIDAASYLIPFIAVVYFKSEGGWVDAAC